MLQYVILGFLSYFTITGYELERYINVSTGHFWHAKLSQIYATLKTMEQKGLIRSTIEAQESRPDRRIYEITDEGSKALQAWLNTPITDLEIKKDALLLKLFFAARMDHQTLLMQLRLQRDLHQQKLQQYQQEASIAIEETVNQYPELSIDAPLWEMTRRFGELYEEMYIRWLDETIHKIENPST